MSSYKYRLPMERLECVILFNLGITKRFVRSPEGSPQIFEVRNWDRNAGFMESDGTHLGIVKREIPFRTLMETNASPGEKTKKGHDCPLR